MRAAGRPLNLGRFLAARIDRASSRRRDADLSGLPTAYALRRYLLAADPRRITDISQMDGSKPHPEVIQLLSEPLG
jgi:hypothetical protein